jgi:glycosyltransferase involved in cell wall biosynthesis
MLTSGEAGAHSQRRTTRRTGIIFVTQLLDPSDPVLGFVGTLLAPLAARCGRLLVIANEIRDIPKGVDAEFESLGKERGDGRLRRAMRYERLLMRLARDGRYGGLFAHMSPVYASLASPILRPRGIRVVLWFAHPTDSWRLGLAERLSSSVLTSLPGAYPRSSAKAIAVGQAIDTERWRFVPPQDPGPTMQVLALGRTSGVKGFPVVIKAVKRAREDGLAVHLRLVGPSTTPAEQRHRSELVRLIRNLELEDEVELLDGVPPHAVPEFVARADVVLNATRAGSGDKTIFEAMASGRLVVVSNPAFAELLSGLPVTLAYPAGDVEAVVDRLRAIAALSPAEREHTARELRDRIIRRHSVSSWADAVTEAATGIPFVERTVGTP